MIVSAALETVLNVLLVQLTNERQQRQPTAERRFPQRVVQPRRAIVFVVEVLLLLVLLLLQSLLFWPQARQQRQAVWLLLQQRAKATWP